MPSELIVSVALQQPLPILVGGIRATDDNARRTKELPERWARPNQEGQAPYVVPGLGCEGQPRSVAAEHPLESAQ